MSSPRNSGACLLLRFILATNRIDAVQARKTI
jgi:hypothetical protein